MKQTTTIIAIAFAMLALAGIGHAQTFAASGASTVSVNVAAEAALSVTDTTTLSAAPGTFANDFTGTTTLLYKIRTDKGNGVAHITSKVTTDFSPANGPSVANSGTTGDTLKYTCTVAAPGGACSSAQTASTSTEMPFASFGADAKSAKGGNNASATWTLINDPTYSTGSYSATVTFTISLT